MAMVTREELEQRQQAVELYRGEELSLHLVAKELGVDAKVVRRWLYAMRVPLRTSSEAARLAFRKGRNKQPRQWRREGGPNTCERCGLVLAGAQNAHRETLCDVCDWELRRGVIYTHGELSAARRAELGYEPGGMRR